MHSMQTNASNAAGNSASPDRRHPENEDVALLIGGKEADIFDAVHDCFRAHCELAHLANEAAQALPNDDIAFTFQSRRFVRHSSV